MVDQASMNNGRAKAGVARSLSGLAHDAITLAELQAQLLAVDLRDGRARAAVSIALIIMALLLILGTMPVLLLGLAGLLVAYAGWSEAAAFIVTAAAALGVAAVMIWCGWLGFQSAITILTRSRRELRENIDWLKETLRCPTGRHETPPGHHRQ